MTMHLYRVVRSLAIRGILLGCLVATAALAHAQGPTFGATLNPFGGPSPIVGVSGTWPFASFDTPEGPITLGGRVDLATALDFATWPALGLGLIADLGHDVAIPYLGSGFSLGWRRLGDEQTALATWTLLGGVRVPIAAAWAIKLEATSAPLLGGVGIAFGAEWSPR